MKSSRVLYLLWLLLIAAVTSARGDSEPAHRLAVDPAVRAAVVRVEAAIDPFSLGPELAAELASRPRWTSYEVELDRRLRVGSTGTGFLVNRRGDVVTTAHVVLSGIRYRGLHFTQAQWDSMALALHAIRDIWVTVGEGEEARSYLAIPAAVSEELDLAVLRVCPPQGTDDDEFVPLPIGHSDDLQVGQFVLAVGFPQDEFQSRSGKILSLMHGARVHEEMQVIRRRDPDTGRDTISLSGTSPGPLRRFQHSAAFGRGSSGAPLVDRQGRVIGVAYAQVRPPRAQRNEEPGVEVLNLAIASNVLRKFLMEHAIPFSEVRR